MNEWVNISLKQATLEDFLLNLSHVSTRISGQDGDLWHSFLYSMAPFPGALSISAHPARTRWNRLDNQHSEHHLDRSEVKTRKSLELLKHVTFPIWCGYGKDAMVRL